MKYFIITFIISLISMICGLATVTSNAVTTRHSYAQGAIYKYFEKTGELPGSWHDLRLLEESNKLVELIEGNVKYGKKNDFVEIFRFIPTKTKVVIRGGTQRVIAMSTRSLRVSGSLTRPDYRLMVIQLENGNIATMRYTEEQTARLFELAGFDLADYTGSDGKWEPEPKKAAPGASVEGSAGNDGQNQGAARRQEKNSDPNGSKEREGSGELLGTPVPLWLLLGMPILLLVWLALSLKKKV